MTNHLVNERPLLKFCEKTKSDIHRLIFEATEFKNHLVSDNYIVNRIMGYEKIKESMKMVTNRSTEKLSQNQIKSKPSSTTSKRQM